MQVRSYLSTVTGMLGKIREVIYMSLAPPPVQNAKQSQQELPVKNFGETAATSLMQSSHSVSAEPVSKTTALATRENPPEAFLAMGHTKEQWQTLTQHLFPNAKSVQSIWLVAKICKAKNLDPLSRPYHIVPMYDAKSQEYIDTIWPGVGLYDIQASRSGEYAGKDPAVYGPTRTFTFTPTEAAKSKGGRTVSIEVPEWCTVTIYKIIDGQRVPFTSDPIYFEEYVQLVKGNNAKAGQPNEQWRSKPRSQLAKCARAAILRSTFPESIGSEPTAEEMEGRDVHPDYVPTIKDTQALAQKIAAERLAAQEQSHEGQPEDGGETIDADLINDGTTAPPAPAAPPPPVTLQDSFAAGEALARDAGNEPLAQAMAEAAQLHSKATTKDTMQLVKVGGQNGWPTAQVVNLIVDRYKLDAKNWSKEITKQQVDEVIAYIQQNPRKHNA